MDDVPPEQTFRAWRDSAYLALDEEISNLEQRYILGRYLHFPTMLMITAVGMTQEFTPLGYAIYFATILSIHGGELRSLPSQQIGFIRDRGTSYFYGNLVAKGLGITVLFYSLELSTDSFSRLGILLFLTGMLLAVVEKSYLCFKYYEACGYNEFFQSSLPHAMNRFIEKAKETETKQASWVIPLPFLGVLFPSTVLAAIGGGLHLHHSILGGSMIITAAVLLKIAEVKKSPSSQMSEVKEGRFDYFKFNVASKLIGFSLFVIGVALGQREHPYSTASYYLLANALCPFMLGLGVKEDGWWAQMGTVIAFRRLSMFANMPANAEADFPIDMAHVVINNDQGAEDASTVIPPTVNPMQL